MNQKLSADQFISLLYCQASSIPVEQFPQWALDLLQQVISFDGAIWGTGHIRTQQFHTQTTLDVSPEIFLKLKEHVDINPIFSSLIHNTGEAIDMSDVLSDKSFYQSEIYKQCFQPFGIERILSSIHTNERSGIFTLLTLYRYDRSQCFTNEEKETQNRLLYHLLSAFSHRQFLALNENKEINNMASALCDGAGVYHAVEERFLNLLDTNLSNETPQQFPRRLNNEEQEFSIDKLHFTQEKLGDLYRLSVRNKTKLDDLTKREKEVVAGICQEKRLNTLQNN